MPDLNADASALRVGGTHPVVGDFVLLRRAARNPLRWLRFIWSARRLDRLVVSGASGASEFYADIVLAAICVRLFPRQKALLVETLWEPGSRALNRLFGITSPPALDAPSRFAFEKVIARALKRLDHPRMHYVLTGEDERAIFSAYWDIPIDRLHFVPFWATAEEQRDRPVEPIGVDVFAGGDSLRDYRTLISAAELIDGEIVVATRLGAPAQLPPNLTYGPTDPDTYARYLAGARVVVVCLRRDAPRSAGQQSYLNAMLTGVPVIVTESLGVRDHIRDGETGVVVGHDPRQLAAAVNEALAGTDAVRRRVQAARDQVAHFSAGAYSERLRQLAVNI